MMILNHIFLLIIAFAVMGCVRPAAAAVFYPSSITLDNGLQLVVVPNHLAPAVTQMVWYKVGSSYETTPSFDTGAQGGLSHYLEHLMFRGTSATPDGAFSKIIAAQGGNDNAFTSYDYTAYFETVASDRLPLIMKMEADRMQNLRITPDIAKTELQVVLDERQQRTDNSPAGRFQEKVQHLLMPHYPYGVPVIGWKKEIEKYTAKDAEHFYQSHYAPNNAVVVISGDVNPDEVFNLAKEIYGTVPQRDVTPPPALPKPTLPAQKNFTMIDAGVEQPEIEMQILMPSYNTQKKHEAYALEVLAEALDGGEVGLLYRKLVKQDHLATGVETNYDPDKLGDALFTIAATPVSVKLHQTLEKHLRDHLHVLASTGISAEDIATAKDRLKNSAAFARDSLMMPGYAFGMALTTGHTVDDVEAWPERIDAVTPNDVNSALRSLVSNPHKIVAALLPDTHASPAAREAARPVIGNGVGIR